MNCHDIRPLLHGYFDGELDLVRNLEVENHLRECRMCEAALDQFKVLRTAVGDSSLRFVPSATFQRRVLEAVRTEHEPGSSRV